MPFPNNECERSTVRLLAENGIVVVPPELEYWIRASCGMGMHPEMVVCFHLRHAAWLHLCCRLSEEFAGFDDLDSDQISELRAIFLAGAGDEDIFEALKRMLSPSLRP